VSATTKRDDNGCGIPAVADLGTDDVEFFDVQGIPVAAVDAIEDFAYDTDPPRVFGFDTVMSEGVPISREQFLQLVAECAKRR